MSVWLGLNYLGKFQLKQFGCFPEWSEREKQFVCNEKKKSNNHLIHLMEKFSQPHDLEQELKALGEDCPYEACCWSPTYPFGKFLLLANF